MKPVVPIGVFTPQDARDIKEKVLNTNRPILSTAKHKGRDRLGWHYVILKEELAPATDPLVGWSQATASVMMYLESADTLDMEEITTESTYLTITNRSTSFSASIGEVLLVRWIGKEWAPIVGSGVGFRHGIVTSNLGCGYYVVELGVWNGDLYSSGSGIGSDTSSGVDRDCDVCYDVVGAGTASCGIELTYPPVQVTGIGQYVTAYHRASALVPLRIGSACMLTGSGSDSPSSVPNDGEDTVGIDNVWHIVDGLQTHTVQYIEEWSCCDGLDETGVETLLTRTPVIFAAKVCDPIQCGTCDAPSSGSA